MWPMDYSQVWRAEHEQSASQRRAADEQSGRLAADLSHIWHATAELVAALVTQTGWLRRRRRHQQSGSGVLVATTGQGPAITLDEDDHMHLDLRHCSLRQR